MKIALVTLGTRGDVQPYIALGKALKARGHEVVLGAPEDSGAWIEGHGLAYRSIGVDMRAFVQSLEARKVMAGNVLAMARMWRETIVPLTRQSLDAIWEVARDAEVIVDHPKTAGAADVAEATGATIFHAAPFPIFPSRAFPLLVFTGDYGPWLNRLSYKLLRPSRMLFRKTVNQWRTEVLGLGKASPFGGRNGDEDIGAGRLCAVSPAVVPGYPADASERIWTTGYWFLDEGRDWRPDPALSAFLARGEPPVYIGFGSMTTGDPARLARTVVEGVRAAGLRAVIGIGWGAIGEIETPATVHCIGGAPYDALFRHVSAVVPHGGAGTTAAGLRAGLPTLICPLAFDQRFWGQRVHALGCGPRPRALKRLTAERFARALIELTRTDSYRVRAGELAAAIAREDGVARAVELIETAAGGGGTRG
ncbi:MAG: glycosyltransferase family 1 protein [Burkholderiales bacterium]|nr:MAG: glycosyltransferase family 1 protein [Burkholderiales bacterium]